ncbi:MAG: CBS domain-containing protein [Thermoguttaceae bacterium]
MLKAKDIMNTCIITVDPDETIEEVMSLMLREKISGMPVVDMTGQLVGIITEFDLLDLVWNPNTEKNKVYHYMTRDIRTVDVDAELVDIADMFQTLPIRRLIVMNDDRIAGIISRRDLIWYVLKLRGKMHDLQNAGA